MSRPWRGLGAVCALVVLATLFAGQAPLWKHIQLQYLEAREVELEKELERAREASAEDRRFHSDAVRVAEDALTERRRERQQLEREVFDFEYQLKRAEQRWRDASDAKPQREARTEVERHRELVDDRKRRLDEMLVEHRAAVTALGKVEASAERLEAELAAARRGSRWRGVVGLRYLAPQLQVRELPTVGRSGQGQVDRCVTCHLGMADDAKALQNVSLPADAEDRPTQQRSTQEGPTQSAMLWSAHSRPELIGAGTAHAFDDIGCTACHGGQGLATDFSRAGHLPADAATEQRWWEQWQWRRSAVEAPILAGQLALAGCVSCHADDVWLDGAPAAEHGRRLVRELGCSGCHGLSGAADDKRRQLDIDAEALGGDQLAAYLANPRDIFPESVKPLYWSSTKPAVRDTEIFALIAWLRGAVEAPSSALPPADPGERDRLVMAALENASTLEAAQARFESMTADQRTLYLGGAVADRYGCQVCHPFEDLDPLPPYIEQAQMGRHLISRVEWGQRPTADWLSEVHGRGDGSVQGNHRWPGLYDLGEADQLALWVRLAGLADPPGPMSVANSALGDSRLSAGRLVIDRFDCRDCHRVEGEGEAAAPPLDGIGARLQESWLRQVLFAEPHARARPWLAESPAEEMPDFGLSALEVDALLEYFSVAAGVTRTSAPVHIDPLEARAGEVVFEVMHCGRCHGLGVPLLPADDSENPLDDALTRPALLDTQERAPRYALASERLRQEWVVDFLLGRLDVATRASTPFLLDAAGQPDMTFLEQSLETPVFAVHAQRLQRVFKSEQETHAFATDPERVAEAVAAYLWSL